MEKKKGTMLKKLKWGVAGCGKFTEETFIPTTHLLRRSSINSVFSHSAQRARDVAEKFGIPKSFDNYEQFLASDINAAYIGSANSDHYEQVIQAAKAGKHVLCDKPLAITSVQAEEMVKACNDNGVFLAVNYVYRFYPLVIKAKELMDSQFLGKLVSITMNFNIDFQPGNNFRYNKKLSGGGALRDLGTHVIDMLRYFGGEISEINGVVDNIIYKSEVDDFSAARVKFKSGGYGFFNVSYCNKRAFNRIEILGHRGAICIEGLIGGRNVPSKLTILHEGEARKSFRKRGNRQLYLLRSVQASLLKNEQPVVSGEDGLINLKLMEELESKCRAEQN